jgi:hypothetical protein
MDYMFSRCVLCYFACQIRLDVHLLQIEMLRITSKPVILQRPHCKKAVNNFTCVSLGSIGYKKKSVQRNCTYLLIYD